MFAFRKLLKAVWLSSKKLLFYARMHRSGMFAALMSRRSKELFLLVALTALFGCWLGCALWSLQACSAWWCSCVTGPELRQNIQAFPNVMPLLGRASKPTCGRCELKMPTHTAPRWLTQAPDFLLTLPPDLLEVLPPSRCLQMHGPFLRWFKLMLSGCC